MSTNILPAGTKTGYKIPTDITANLGKRYGGEFAVAAQKRDVSPAVLAKAILTIIVRDRLYDTVLDGDLVFFANGGLNSDGLTMLQADILSLISRRAGAGGMTELLKSEISGRAQASRQSVWNALRRLNELGFIDFIEEKPHQDFFIVKVLKTATQLTVPLTQSGRT